MLTLLACAGPAADPGGPGGTGSSPDSETGGMDTGESQGGGDPTLTCQITMSCPSGILDDPKSPCDLSIVSGDGEPVYDGMAMVELRGRSSAEFVKPPYGVELHRRAEHLVVPHATWHYQDGTTPAPEGWEAPGYDDGDWATGMAPLGFGDAPATEIGYGSDESDKPASARFRATFEVDDPSGVAELSLDLMRDDGALIWLNGTLVAASNVADDAGADDLAIAVVQEEFETYWIDYDIDPALLVAGQNTLAVEVHQASVDSSDLSFDAALTASTGRLSPNLFGMGGEDDWMLYSAYIDRVLWRNKLAYDLFQSFGESERWAAEQVFCELTLDGDYRGVYLLGELPRRDDDRLVVGDDTSTGANLIVKMDDEGGFLESVATEGEWQSVWPAQREEYADDVAAVSAVVSGWEESVMAGDVAQWDAMELDSAVDWVILQELFKNNDAYFLSIHLWRDQGGPLRHTPWDVELSLGYPYYDCGAESFLPRRDFIDMYAADPAFTTRLAERWGELRQDQLSDEAILARIAAYEATLGDAIARNFERWPVDEIVFSWGDVDNWLCPASTWEEEHDRVLAWIPARTAWLDENIGAF